MKKERDELDEKIKKAVSEMARPETTSCPDEEALVCYLEGRLDERERDEIEGHLAACSSCCDQVIAMNRVIHAEMEAPAALEDAIQKAMDLIPGRPLGTLKPLEEEKKESIMSSEAIALKKRVSWKPFGFGIAAAVICVLLIFMVPYVLNIPILGLGKFGSPLELSVNLTGKITSITERGVGAGPSMVTIEEGDVLKSHDGFQIRFKTSRDAYAYVVLHSSRGNLKLLFPHPEIRMSNKIEGGQNYTLPSKDRWFFLDENIGMETAFVLASKRTIDDIETVIDSLKNENINKVKKILEKKAGVVKAISFRHIDDKPFQNLRSFDSSLGNALDEASIKSSPYYEKIEAYRDLIQPFLDTARESRNIEKKLVRTFNRVREKHFQDTTRGAGSSVFKKASPAVVIIETDIFEGAGFICNSPDYVITNWHVVEGSEEVFVIYKPSSGIGVKRGNAVVAEVVKVDEVADLALLKIKHPRKNITPLGLGDINQIEPGQDVHAIGHPASQYWTYTRGVVSAIRPNYEWEFSDGSQHKSSVIQTQTPINPGNSGGPLLDDQAKIIGVNCWRLGGEGLNYAISVDEVKKFLRRKESRKTQHLTETMRLAEAIIAEYEAKEIEVLDYDKNGIPEKIRLTFEGVEKITNEIEITANYFVLIQDSDQDGRIDFLGSTLPPNCGIWQDLDSDGYMEVQMIDLDCNGTTDIYGIDENRDGKIDTYF